MKNRLRILNYVLLAMMMGITISFVSCKKDDGGSSDDGKIDPSTIATDSLVAYFPFDGNGVDKIANLTPQANSYVTYATGRRNQCYQGDSLACLLYDLTSSSKLTSMTKGFTVACWLYAPKVDGTPVPKIFEISNSDNLNWGNICWMQERITLEGADSCYFKFHLYTEGGENWAADKTSPDLIAGRWSHYIITYDGSNSSLNLYKDGAIISKMSYTLENAGLLSFVKPERLIIGGWLEKILNGDESEWMGWFKGKMDELRVYNASLSATQAKNLYDAEVTQMTE